MALKSFGQFLNEGVYDPSSRKVFYIVGGPGSGKSYVTKKTTGGLGLKTVNSDDAFESEMKKQDLEMSPENIYSPLGQAIRNRAKQLTQNKEKIYTQNRLGMVIDGTGKDFDKIKAHSEHMKSQGYDPHMIFVNTSLDVAKQRNQQRARSLPDAEVEKMHHAVQNNLGAFQDHFGRNMHIVDNSHPDEDVLTKLHKTIRNASAAPVRNPIGRDWEQRQLQQKRINPQNPSI